MSLSSLLFMFLSLLSCGNPKEQARNRLQQMNISFTEDAFVERAKEGNLEVVKLFLDAGMSPEVTNKTGVTALLMAARFGRRDIVELLLKQGTDPNAKDKKLGGTPLLAAAIHGDPALITLLLANGADLNGQADKNGMTALMGAALAGQTAALQALLDKGAKIDAVDLYDRTALMWAAYHGSLETVKLLLDKGAAMELKEKGQGMTALVWAAARGKDEVVKVLINNGADSQCSGQARENGFDVGGPEWGQANCWAAAGTWRPKQPSGPGGQECPGLGQDRQADANCGDIRKCRGHSCLSNLKRAKPTIRFHGRKKSSNPLRYMV